MRYGNTAPENLRKAGYGSGMLVEFKSGKGVCVHAGSTEWVVGLAPQSEDADTVAITRNVIHRAIAVAKKCAGSKL